MVDDGVELAKKVVVKALVRERRIILYGFDSRIFIIAFTPTDKA